MKEMAKELGMSGSELEVLGPVASPISRIKDRYRFQCMIKYRGDADVSALAQRGAAILDETVKQHKLTVSIDVDPQLLM
ncbi:hypothetical protein LJK87_16405 [Paenibacillus sp. P25]|nr:hypothetical protein LJK87_16405 [Paenibacillus sp. P25]